ncbi:unnamed protein product [Litomosoides sigmodontis]|uniref:Uncharacterized protein n=1 Tax=Litomosoides sigmodontis TaxID=42156 RepID=A0A3P6TQ38_LITSI|nr:unnamed protein product [Litomosoides sigmodontis]
MAERIESSRKFNDIRSEQRNRKGPELIRNDEGKSVNQISLSKSKNSHKYERNATNDENASPVDGEMRKSKARSHNGLRYSHSSSHTDRPAQNYITDAEINTRGYVDQNGQIHYSIPVLPVTREPTYTVKETASERRSDAVSCESNLCGRKDGNIVRVVRCSVGDKDDRGRLDYQMYDDGRIYDLKCSDGRSLVLSFSRKEAALVVNRRRSCCPSFS